MSNQNKKYSNIDLLKKIRKPPIPKSKFHTTKKGEKGYNRKRDKRKFYDEDF